VDELFVPSLLLKCLPALIAFRCSLFANDDQRTTALFLCRRLLADCLLLHWRLGFGFQLRTRRSFRCRLLASRRPCSWGRAVPVLLRQHDFEMRDAPHVVISASHWRRTNALHARSVVRHRVLHVQVIEIDIQALLGAQVVGVVDRRLQKLSDRRRHALLGKGQRVPRLFHAPPLDQVQHQPRLLGRDPHKSCFRSKFHNLSQLLALSYWLLAKSQKPTANSRSYAFGAGADGADGTIAPGPPGTPAGFAATSVAAFIECPLNWRVKLNSPSLCPTMFSVTYTGMNFRPLCTAIVCPTISGIIVERRDHVRSTFFSLRAFMASTFVARCASTNGPFFVERAIN